MFNFLKRKRNDGQNSPGVQKYETLKSELKDKKLVEALVQVASGNRQVPVSLGLKVKKSVADINYLVNLTDIPGNQLVTAIINKTHDKELRNLILAKEKKDVLDTGQEWIEALIEWAKENELPELQQHATIAYRQTGFPRTAVSVA